MNDMQDVTQELGVKAMQTFILIKKEKEVDKVVGAIEMISKEDWETKNLIQISLQELEHINMVMYLVLYVIK